MQAPTAEVQAVLEVLSEVDEGISFTFFWQLTHFRGRRSVRKNCENLHPVKVSCYTVLCSLYCHCRLPNCAGMHQIPREAENNQRSTRDWYQVPPVRHLAPK